MKSTLSVMVVCHGPAAGTEPFVQAMRKSFLGTESAQGYTSSDYELLDPLDFRVFSWPGKDEDPTRRFIMPDSIKRDIAARSEAVLVLLLLAMADEGADGLVQEWSAFTDETLHSFVMVVSLAAPGAPPLPQMKRECMAGLGLDDLNERDLRRDLLALQAYNFALRLFTQQSATPGGAPAKPSLFISHAKRDGVPLARSIMGWIEDLPGFEFFYDTRNLDLNANISAQLEQAVSGSILIVLRTEVFEQRYWCQKEIYWAEKHGVPVLGVDGRWSLQHAPSVIVFDSSPSVRIPDGSIVRILLAAMTEALRVALFRARVRIAAGHAGLSNDCWTTVPRFPSLGSLHSATERLQATCPTNQDTYVFHPNPALPDGLREVATEMAAARLSRCNVLSLDELRVLI